jgi:mitochondrial fission protein ELM1
MKTLWALTDYRVGTANQVLGVANNVAGNSSFEVIEKKLSYSKLAELPNGLQQLLGLKVLTKLSASYITPPYPDLVISAGRRAAVIARYIKNKHPEAKLVHIMSPELPYKFFDLLVMPSHDFPAHAKNIMQTLGSPHNLNDEMLNKARLENPLGHLVLPKPWTMICLGGNTSFGRFSLKDCEKLVAQLEPIAQEGGSFLITASRRTPAAIMQMMLEWVSQKYPEITIKSYSPEQQGLNPYHSWLAQADRAIITADSVSMISEAAFTYKPIYVFNPSEAAGRKHLQFINSMIDEGNVKPLTGYDAQWQRTHNLDEAARVALQIKSLFE